MITIKDGRLLSRREIICLSAIRNDLSGSAKNYLSFLRQIDKVIKYSYDREE